MARQGVDVVVSLLESQEARELEIEDEESLCEEHNIEFISFPIQDRSTPRDENAYVDLISEINKRLENNKKIAIHCRMGIGRTSVVAAGTLIANGFDPGGVFDLLSEKRTLAVPDTDDQVSWTKKMEKSLRQIG